MQALKIFLASSDELVHERLVFSRIVLELGAQLRGSGTRIALLKWEFLDPSMGPMHKQEEYNRELATCDIVFVLFWRHFGEYTEEEFRMALDGMRNRQRPRKVVVMFKNDGSEVADGLVVFRDSLEPGDGLDVMEFSNDDELCKKAKESILLVVCTLEKMGHKDD